MSLVESKAAFQQRCNEVYGGPELGAAFSASGVESFSALAFAIGTPSSTPTEAQFDTFAGQLFPRGRPTVGQISAIKRLHFESAALVIAATKETATADSEKSDTIKNDNLFWCSF